MASPVLLCIIDTSCFPLWPERSVGVVRGEVNNPFSCVYALVCMCIICVCVLRMVSIRVPP